jgi:hypothetical protein
MSTAKQRLTAELSTTGQIIEVARRFLRDVDTMVRIADEVRAGDRHVKPTDTQHIQNITRAAVASRIWRQEGRQVLVMHPAVVDEVAVAGSDKIAGEVLRTLPYLSPLVLYAAPPEFKTWASDPGGDGYTVPGETMRLLGFMTFSYGPLIKNTNVPADWYDVFANCHYNTHDARGGKFGIAALFDVLDSVGRRVDSETSMLSIPFDTVATLAETVDEQLHQFR